MDNKDKIIDFGVDFGNGHSVSAERKFIGIKNSKDAISNGTAIPSIFDSPKIKMKQIGGPDIIGERISIEPIIDKFGNTRYIHSEGRVVKENYYPTKSAESFLWEELADNIHLELSKIRKNSF